MECCWCTLKVHRTLRLINFDIEPKTIVVTKFSTGFSRTTCIYLMTAPLLEFVKLRVMIVSPTSPSVLWEQLVRKSSCRLADPIGISEHLPILIEINH